MYLSAKTSLGITCLLFRAGGDRMSRRGEGKKNWQAIILKFVFVQPNPAIFREWGRLLTWWYSYTESICRLLRWFSSTLCLRWYFCAADQIAMSLPRKLHSSVCSSPPAALWAARQRAGTWLRSMNAPKGQWLRKESRNNVNHVLCMPLVTCRLDWENTLQGWMENISGITFKLTYSVHISI